ncbi:response regulator [Citrobacter freundii]|uniref:response regulator n=1 Tax=Citrobacter freundii TaxID=546 RepID=UPI0015E92564|nr:response regulator [Citrobacter freundii]QLY59951.1 response regulator [Citrobacter freundii]
MRVIIVDDDKVRSASIKNWLVAVGITSSDFVTIVSCTNMARTSIKNFFYDILILDVVLPKRDDDKSKWINGIDLLNYINTSPFAKKPSKIIGMTAYSDDIQNFKAEFERYCFTVVEVVKDNEEWKPKFLNVFNYQSSSKLASLDDEKPIIAMTVHGIRTIGNWQEKLRTLIQSRASYIDFQTYKYGYFAGINFFIPFIRNAQIKRLKAKLTDSFKINHNKQYVFFAHSFGTYIVARAINEIIENGDVVPQLTLVLAGSVLPSNYNLNTILDHNKNNVIINDCGNSDYVLWLSEAFVPSTGMAGRTGFYGVSNSRFVNRYHPGGHSHYFDVDGFMEKYWLPILWNDTVIGNTDIRPFSFFEHGILEQLVVLSRKLKFLYPLIFVCLLYFAFR